MRVIFFIFYMYYIERKCNLSGIVFPVRETDHSKVYYRSSDDQLRLGLFLRCSYFLDKSEARVLINCVLIKRIECKGAFKYDNTPRGGALKIP